MDNTMATRDIIKYLYCAMRVLSNICQTAGQDFIFVCLYKIWTFFLDLLPGREYHRHLSLFNPYSVLFQNLQLFFE